jgi:hypothetical protein
MGFGDKFKARRAQKAAAAALAQANLVHEQLDYMALSEATDDVPGVMLKAGEVAYAVVEGAAFVEPKRAPGQWKGRSQGTSIRVAKGVRYRVGGSKGTFQQGEERWTPTDTGTFLITNQRFIFVGSKRTTEWAYSKLIGYDTDGPGTTFFNVSNRQKTTGVLFGEEAENRLFAVIAAALAQFAGPENHAKLIAAVEAEYSYQYSVWQALSEGRPAPTRPPTPESDEAERPPTGGSQDAENRASSPRRSTGLPSAGELRDILTAAGFTEVVEKQAGFDIRHEGDRLKVFWLKLQFEQNPNWGARDARISEMAKALRDAGCKARVVPHNIFKQAYISVTAA